MVSAPNTTAATRHLRRRAGLTAALEYLSSDDSLGGDRDWQRAELGLGVAVPFRRNIWWITLRAVPT